LQNVPDFPKLKFEISVLKSPEVEKSPPEIYSSKDSAKTVILREKTSSNVICLLDI